MKLLLLLLFLAATAAVAVGLLAPDAAAAAPRPALPLLPRRDAPTFANAFVPPVAVPARSRRHLHVRWSRRSAEIQEDDGQPAPPPAAGPSQSIDAGVDVDAATTSPTPQTTFECEYCGEVFVGRNALFRHLRSGAHPGALGEEGPPARVTRRRGKVAVLFGYDANQTRTSSANEDAANLVRDAFVAVAASSSAGTRMELGEVTQTTSASARQPSLAQEVDCPAASDVLVVNYNYQSAAAPSSEINGTRDGRWDDRISPAQLTKDMNAALLELEGDATVRVHATEFVPVRTKLHAEWSATQRSYHYLLPLSWLGEDGREAARWVVRNGKVAGVGGSKVHQKRGSSGPTPPVLRRLKESLRAAVGAAMDADVGAAAESSGKSGAQAQSFVGSPGRFGSLWKKRKRCWHNFCDPTLALGGAGGLAGPSNEAVWRCLDKASVVEFLVDEGGHCGRDTTRGDENDVVAVLEFTGDGFVTEQVRRLVGTANGWLPVDFCALATGPSVTVETPLAPSGRSYFAGARFHFHELSRGGTLLFSGQDENGGRGRCLPSASEEEWIRELRARQLVRRGQLAQDESRWLRDLEDVVAPRIRERIEEVRLEDVARREDARRQHKALFASEDRAVAPPVIPSIVPPAYEQTLSLLRDIARDGKWPPTSVARSRVMRSPDIRNILTQRAVSVSSMTMASTYSGQLYQAGSFTVVNEDLFDGPIPVGNKLFPGLAKSVFELEGKLSDSRPRLHANGTQKMVSHKVRPPSTHCAINRNVEFTAHVNSGQGQSLSLLVGLGDYAGGRLFVEGAPYDVQYEPLEFNGWTQCHWTEPFEGERFSLVWFTPEKVEIGGKKSYASENQDFRKEEDVEAEILARTHDKQMSSYPPLRFRHNSTDALVIKEILDVDKGCSYEYEGGAAFRRTGHEAKRESRRRMISFSPRDHHVLDIGAHIGVFTRYALNAGCRKVTAYEPEGSNADLLRQNARPLDGDDHGKVEIHSSAVAHGEAGMRNLVRARNRNDGTMNTWRHSLESYSQYVDKSTELPSPTQESTLTRSQVSTVPFFGGALKPGITFCKLDCEGAEVDILLAPEAAKVSSWLNVTHLVFEWSFTKERRVELFHRAAQNLEDAGFCLSYEGLGSWWDTESNVMWPFHSDLVIFAVREEVE